MLILFFFSEMSEDMGLLDPAKKKQKISRDNNLQRETQRTSNYAQVGCNSIVELVSNLI